MVKNNEIIGYSRFKNKEGKERLVVDVAKQPTDFDTQYGRVGMKVEQIWMPEALYDRFNPSVVGKQIDCSYMVNGRYANVVDVGFK